MHKVKPIYFDSKINKERERFEIIESSIGFNHDDFRERILDELAFLGMTKEELAESCYIGEGRIAYLFNKKYDFLPSEISEIRKRLGF